MLDFIYQSGWGAFAVLLFFQLPFLVVFLFIVYRSVAVKAARADTAETSISRTKTLWLVAVALLFIAINFASIQYIPAVSTARAVAANKDIRDVRVTAQSWSYEMSEQEFEAGDTVRFTANSVDTVHGFAVYDPDGDVLFTMMLIPGAMPSSLIQTFDDAGTYKVRCLEYCGIAHHEMNDEIIVRPRSSQEG